MPVITHEDILSLPQADEVFRGGEEAVLNKVCTTRMIAVQDIDKLKKISQLVQRKFSHVFQRKLDIQFPEHWPALLRSLSIPE